MIYVNTLSNIVYVTTYENGEVVVTTSNPSPSQASITFEDEGSTLGTRGTVNEIDFVGSGVAATRSGDKLTVTITSGGGSGDVVGPGSATANNLVTFDGTTGKLIKDGGTSISALQARDYVSLMGGCSSGNPADGQTYYIGADLLAITNGTAAARRVYIPVAGTIVYARVIFLDATVLGSGETSTINIRLNNTTDTVISAAVTVDALTTTFSNNALSIAVVDGDYIEFKWVTPTWATNPTGVSMKWEILIQL